MDFLFDNTIDTTNITNVLLIDKDTLNYEIFYNSCNETTFPIVYSKSCNRNDLLQLLINKFTKIHRLSFVFSFQPAYVFLNNELLFRDDESIPYSENVTFIIDLINRFNISTIDYLACDTLNYENWQNYYNIILSNTTAIVGASNDLTGNLKYGGDWTMESTNQDIELIYFNTNIQNYQNLLDYQGSFNVFLMENNTIYGCGLNSSGQLGLGYTSTGETSLVQMPNTTGKTPISISYGEFHTIVLMSDGTIYGCGSNNSGELGIGNVVSPQTSLVQMSNTTGKTPVSISCGRQNTFIFMSDNTIYVCGRNDRGQLGIGSTSYPSSLTLMLMPSGKIPSMVSVGDNHTIVLMTDGTMYSCGANGQRALGISGTSTFYTTLQAMPNNTGKTPAYVYGGGSCSIVFMSDGTIYGCGYNQTGGLGLGYTSGAITPFGTTGLMVNNTGKTPIEVYAGGSSFTIVLMDDRTIYGTGTNNNGQLGDGSTTNKSVITEMSNTTGKIPVAISTSAVHTIVLMSDGTIYGTGRNVEGQLGLGSTTPGIITTLIQIPNTTGLKIKKLSGSKPTVYKINPTISNFSIPIKPLNNSPFQITPPTSNSSGSFSYSSSNTSVATISGDTITIVGLGTTTITATQAETDYCNSGTGTTTFLVQNPTPTISSFSIPTKTIGDSSFTITQPTSNSDGSFSYSSSNTSIATISGNTITIVGVGTATITATQTETTSYSAGTATASFQVNKAAPSINGFSVSTKTFGDSAFTITPPTSNSSGSFSYSSSNTSVATISGNTITIVGAGTATITATQAESTNYSSGTITASFQVSKANPSITGFSIPTKTYGDSPFTITQPTSNSGGSFSYSSSNTSVATISGNTITIVSPGTTTITATQTTTTNYTSGTQTASFQVSKITTAISGFSVPTKKYGNIPFIITPPTTSNSSGSFSYSSSNTLVATIYGNILTIVGAGTATITATQAATTFYTSGTITASFQVSKAIPIISALSIPGKKYGDSPFTIPRPITNSNGTFSYSSSNTSVATISGSTITIINTGISTITATLAETSNYTSGTITGSFQVASANLSLSNFSIPAKTYGDSPFTITPPTSNSSGSFSYTSADPSVATISGNIITIVGAGTATIIAVQKATASYISGTITTSFQVAKATPRIIAFSIPTKTYGDAPFTILRPISTNYGGTFTYISSDSSVATISGNTLTVVGVGTVIIIAVQSATTNYTSVTESTVLQVLSP